MTYWILSAKSGWNFMFSLEFSRENLSSLQTHIYGGKINAFLRAPSRCRWRFSLFQETLSWRGVTSTFFLSPPIQVSSSEPSRWRWSVETAWRLQCVASATGGRCGVRLMLEPLHQSWEVKALQLLLSVWRFSGFFRFVSELQTFHVLPWKQEASFTSWLSLSTWREDAGSGPIRCQQPYFITERSWNFMCVSRRGGGSGLDMITVSLVTVELLVVLVLLEVPLQSNRWRSQTEPAEPRRCHCRTTSTGLSCSSNWSVK